MENGVVNLMRQSSAVGQSRRFNRGSATSGLPLTTDITRPADLVRFVPEADNGNFILRWRRLSRFLATHSTIVGRCLPLLIPLCRTPGDVAATGISQRLDARRNVDA